MNKLVAILIAFFLGGLGLVQLRRFMDRKKSKNVVIRRGPGDLRQAEIITLYNNRQRIHRRNIPHRAVQREPYRHRRPQKPFPRKTARGQVWISSPPRASLQLRTTTENEPDKIEFSLRTRLSRIYFRKRFFDYPISLKPATFIGMGFVNTMKAGFGYLGVIQIVEKSAFA